MRWGHTLGWIAVVGLLRASAAAQEAGGGELSAEDEQARTLYLQGEEAYVAGDFATAAARFHEAYRASPRPALLFNLGSSYDRMRDEERAIEWFERYLAQAPDAPNRLEVRSRVAELRRSVEEQRATLEAARAEGRDDTPLLAQWWFWLAAGVVVAGGVVAVLLLTRGVEDPALGSTGQVSRALVEW